MRRRFLRSSLVLVLFASGLWTGAGAVAPAPTVAVIEGQSEVIDFPFDIETISITDPEVADVLLVTANQVLINGNAAGITTLIVWDKAENHYSYRVVVETGKARAQIRLRVRVAEVNTDNARELGIDWTVGDRSDFIEDGSEKMLGLFGGSVQTPSLPLSIGDGVSGYVNFVGDEQSFSAIVHALTENGALKLLAKPDLVCMNGEEATFLSGGEIPIPIAQTATISGGINLTIEWKEYGVRLGFTPTIIDSNLIQLKVEPEVSNLDYSNAITSAGFNIPALRTRKASTVIELENGQSFLIGGLLSQTETELVSKVPLLGSIPILGMAFRSTSVAQTETELMILVSPEIVEPLGESEVPPLPWTTEEDDR